MNNIKITRISRTGKKSTQIVKQGEEWTQAPKTQEETPQVVNVNNSVIINLPESTLPPDDGSPISKSPFSKKVSTKIIRQMPKTTHVKPPEPEKIPDTPNHLIFVKVGQFDVQCRLMSTKITEDGQPDTIIGQCPVCSARIEYPIECKDQILACSQCGEGKPGVVLAEAPAGWAGTIIEPVSCGLMNHDDFGLDEPLKVMIKDE